MDPIIFTLSMLGTGILAGFLGSLLGIGGGTFVTPFITLCLGVDIKYAVGASLIVVIATSTGSTVKYIKKNLVNLRMAMFLEIFTTVGALIGALITGLISPQTLYVLFSLFLVFCSVNMLKKLLFKRKEVLATTSSDFVKKLKLNGSYHDKATGKNINYEVERLPLGASIMFGAGLASGMLGIGSGPFKVIAMDNAMKMPLKPSSSTSNFMIGVTATTSALIHFFNGRIQCGIAVPLAIGVVLGSFIGTKVMPYMNPRMLRFIFVVVLLFFAINMVMKAF